MRRRVGRPGLIGTVARTAVISGTATAVSGGVQRRAMARQAEREPPPTYAPATPATAAPDAGAPDRLAQIRELGAMKADGLLTEEEFTAEKARILGS